MQNKLIRPKNADWFAIKCLKSLLDPDSNPRGESGQRLKDALTGRVGVLEKRGGCGGG
ncbi:hypothetical protein PF005_g29758 [Phytophthora fragariae]|uniref:Uncharacterized protein n=1 Tax=Phytophthora fragariae TaxID=53985 RepID=A0A6A3VE50_9STRA|nr:hypothetical protein PF003_g16542 [Phytophthora fragariae]KAE9093047.1 hypothetical protein PF010_g17642 [Phytophthora fragariae]KAE9165086.1 hypothetical protein PF005_g29758 [Phytophthora fragariae]KAE9170993.1 hypothetical protein PF002_g29942 [Phytophthora fragariae]KAE9268958.1 hypothetical protein PF001_g29436 [Phytophthora fragariae]